MPPSVSPPEARWWRHSGQDALVRLLGEVWDPIGVSGEVAEEYAGYAPRLVGALRTGTDAVADRLLGFEREEMGMDGDVLRARRAAARLCAWWAATAPTAPRPSGRRRPRAGRTR